MEEQFLSYFVSMHLFLNKIVYRKECKQSVTWPVVPAAPGGRAGVSPSVRTRGRKPEERLLPETFLVCALNHLQMSWGDISLFNFETVFEINCCCVLRTWPK
ncbi:unnamed protein product [Rangifer tarandus platyrhynchus]|uniref:Uncharacterized protein n=2 Tax=Rangifer tarandus platyrhynchus TaxID=3082113 RepID=A0AC59Z460_RANTA|nr:unnamed protein product [Rangifer tarandus platyrhynchus]